MEELNPKQLEFVRCYTDPSLPCYLVARHAAELAGYSAAYGKDLMAMPAIQDEIQRVMEQRQELHRDVLDHLWDARTMAVENLITSVRDIQSLRIIDPEKEFGDGAKEVIEVLYDENGEIRLTSQGQAATIDHTNRFREINKHNANVLKLRQEARLAAMDMLSYVVGKPEQVIRHKNESIPTPEKINELTDEDLNALLDAAHERLQERVIGGGEVEVELIGELPPSSEGPVP